MERVLKYIPLYTGALIFLGYWNLHFYYRYFEINIYDFVNTGEIIVSFFPIMLDAFIALIIVAIFIGLTALQTEDVIMKEIKENEWNFRKMFSDLFNKESYTGFKWYRKVIIIILKTIDILVKSLSIIFLIYGVYFSLDVISHRSQELYKYYIMVVVSFVITYMVVSPWITRKIIQDTFIKYKKDIRMYVIIGEAFLIFFSINTLSNVKDAKKVLIGKPDYIVSFRYKDSLYTSDYNFVFIGKTQDYAFFRNLAQNTNVIFPINSLEKITMQRIYYPLH